MTDPNQIRTIHACSSFEEQALQDLISETDGNKKGI